MTTKHLLRKLELLKEANTLQEELKGLLADVMAGSLRAALGEENAKRDLDIYMQRLKSLQSKAEDLDAESQTIDLLMSMGIDTQD